MNIDVALTRLLTIINAGSLLLESARRVSGAIQRARTEGRDLSQSELDAFAHADDEATAALEKAIGNARIG